MRLLTFTRHQKNNILYTPIEGVIPILKIEFTLPKTKDDKIRLTDEVIILYKRKREEKPILIVLSKGSYSIDQFNQLLTKNNEILTSQWEPSIIENYQLKIPDSYTFIASNLLFKALGITNVIKLSAVKSLLFKGDYQTTLTPTPKNIYFYCNQIDELANEINGQPSKLLHSWDVSESQGDLTYSPKHAVNSNHLIFLQLRKTCHRLEFALLDNQNNEIIPKSFYLQLCNKNDECIR